MPSAADHLCVVIGRTRHKMIQIEIQEAARRGATLLELRLDFLAKAPDFKRILVNKPCPVVATARRPEDGGRWAGTEEARIMLLRQAIVAGFDWVDLECDVADSIRRFRDVKRIVSYHNLTEVPDDLEEIHARMCTQDADVVKLAVFAQQPEDNLRVLDLLRSPAKPTVAFCMGDIGVPSRILSARCGAPFTYVAFNKDRIFAPGMPSFDELKEIYRFGLLNADTKVYGVIGDPVAHSLSPLIHNRAMHHVGIDGVYVPFRVPRGRLPQFLTAFDRFPVHGYSVTIPHKEAAAAAGTDAEEAVTQIGAANTLIRREEGGFAAFNTDYEAALTSLQEHLAASAEGGPSTLAGRTVLLLGAGGVARALAHGIRKHGAALTITNRSADRANALAKDVDARVVNWPARHSVVCDTLINATAVGMHPNVDESPVHPSFLKPGLVVFDTVYNPETTLLVREARQRGCKVLTGVDMFVRQAALQFKLFTGQEAPYALMLGLVKRIFSPVKVTEETAGEEDPDSLPTPPP